MEKISIHTLLNKLTTELQTINNSLANAFDEGLPIKDIQMQTADLPVELPQEVYSLYSWKNGLNEEKTSIKTVGELQLFSLGIFSSLEDSILEYKRRAIYEHYWDKRMFPLFYSGGGDFYLIDCRKNAETYRMLWLWSMSFPEFDFCITKYDSLKSLMSSILECFRQKAYSYKPSKPEDFAEGPFLEIDRELEAKICKPINPKSDYWKMF